MSNLDAIAVENFREYLRIPSVHPNVDYEPCVKFLQRLAQDVGFDLSVCRNIPSNPHVILTWTGTQPQLPTIMLNSHMDVVPVFENEWSYKPFGGKIDEEGNIYGRGAQDTKGVGIQYVEAIRRLKQSGYKPKRTVHVVFSSDEEMGGENGLKQFVKSEYFKKLNVAFALDEGVPGADNKLIKVYENGPVLENRRIPLLPVVALLDNIQE